MAPAAQKSSLVAERSASYFLIKPQESFHKPNNYNCYSFVNVKQCKWKIFPSFKLKLNCFLARNSFSRKELPMVRIYEQFLELGALLKSN